MDVTRFLKFVREKELSFYYAMIYASTHAANEIINFRYRIREDKVVLHESIHPSFTDLSNKQDDLFKIVTVDLKLDIFEFVQYAKDKSQSQTEYFPLNQIAGRDDLVYITCIPWVSFTHISHTFSLNKNDSVPRISWGKYFIENDKVLLPFSVQVNHALVDGVHVGEYFTKLQKRIDNIYQEL
ncbi:CatA-like O-acetyltransferase [Ruminiclostridium josui]|uniref:CatA-like O-acetyltransferase n=1 Tax=Ruminiclostridium josui TaxID=1499 RepID=UPI0030EBAA2E